MNHLIVLDTNCLVQMLSVHSPARPAWDAYRQGRYTRHYTPHFRFGLIEQDPDDNKFVDCAIIAGADYIVSEDAHFRALRRIPFPTVNVIGLDEFVNEVGEKKD